MDVTGFQGQFRMYFGASYGSAQTALRRLEEPHIMQSAAIANNTVWDVTSRYQKAAPSLFVDNGAFSQFPDPGYYETSIPTYFDCLEEAVETQPAGTDVRYALRDIPASKEVLDGLDITVDMAQQTTIEYHQRCLRHHRDRDLQVTPYTVLQGQTPDDYLAHLAAHEDAGTFRPTIGVGSLTGRPIDEISASLSELRSVLGWQRYDLHGFGITPRVLVDEHIRHLLDSADTNKWSYGQYEDRIAGSERMYHLMAKKYVDTKRLIQALFALNTVEVRPDLADDVDIRLRQNVVGRALADDEKTIALPDGRPAFIPRDDHESSVEDDQSTSGQLTELSDFD